MNKGDKIIQVCSACGTASCWYGEFMCNVADTAGLEMKTVSELSKDKKENAHYWSDEKMTAVFGTPAPFGYK